MLVSGNQTTYGLPQRKTADEHTSSPVTVPCPTCNGTMFDVTECPDCYGHPLAPFGRPCCGGEGCSHCSSYCSTCRGAGKIEDECQDCEGGQVELVTTPCHKCGVSCAVTPKAAEWSKRHRGWWKCDVCL